MTMRSKLALIVAAGGAFLCLQAVGVYADDAAVKHGKEVFDTAKPKCSACHSIADVGNKKGPLDGVGKKLSAAEIREWIVNPKDMTTKMKAERKPMMPAYPKLTKEDVDALVAYLGSLK
jgi:mono/diheme cytochrome c family protein